MCISQCAWVPLHVSHDFLVINKLVVCSLSILPPKIYIKYYVYEYSEHNLY